MSEDTSTEFLREASQKLRPYSSSLFGADGDERPVVYSRCGTFVRCETKRCLLTAAHVSEPLKAFGRVGFSSGDARPDVKVDRRYVSPVRCWTRIGGQWGPWGPDLASVESPDAGTLEPVALSVKGMAAPGQAPSLYLS